MSTFKIIFISVLVLLTSIGLLWGQGIVPTDMNSPKDIVQARKALMLAIKLNMDDVKAKMKLERPDMIRANAQTLDVLARLIPPLYRDALKEAYEGTGNYFKGAPAEVIQSIAAKLSKAAQKLGSAAAAEDMAAIQSGVGNIFQTCGACHTPYRGKF